MNSTDAEFEAQPPARRLGRRPGRSGARDAIADAARGLFAARGYDRTTLREVAAAAGVDPALVSHYFGSKQRLFVAVVELPFSPSEVLPALLAGDAATVGERFAGFVLAILDDAGRRAALEGMVRAAASEPEAAAMVRALVTRELLPPIAGTLGAKDADLRATLVGAQVVGLLMARYVVRVEPLASAAPAAVAGALAPVFQRLLVEPL